MTQMLREAVERTGRSSEYTVDEHRSNRSLMLSGGRGTGKTSLLLTLKEAITSRSGFNIKEPEIRANVENLRGKLIWLHTLDMEPLPHPTNLLVAILARVEKALEKYGNSPRDYGLLATGGDIEKKLLDLQRITTDASLAWDGNVKDRATSLDPDSYASEVLRAEKARIRVDIDFPNLLRDLAQLVNPEPNLAPLFVLPVDDFDLSPVRCLELLRLLRAVSAPNLFTIVLGDIDVAEFAFDLKLSGDLAKVAGISLSARDVIDSDFARKSTDISRSAIRKLLPPGQRLLLHPYTVSEALQIKSYGSNMTLLELLQKREINFSEKTNRHSVRLAELMLGGDSLPGEYSYISASILKSPARQLVDFYLFLNSNRSSLSSMPLIDHLLNWGKEVINGDTRLQAKICRGILEDLEQSVRNKQFSSSLLEVQAASTRTRLQNTRSNEGIPVRYDFSYVTHIEIVAQAKDEGDGTKTVLQDRTAGFLTLIHDLLFLSASKYRGSNIALPNGTTLQLGNTVWEIGTARIRVPWSGFIARSFWELERFLNAWDYLMQRSVPSDSIGKIKSVSHLWIALCFHQIMLREDDIGNYLLHKHLVGDHDVESTLQHTKWLFENITDPMKEDVIVQLAVLFSCETCLPEEIVRIFWKDERISNTWKRHSFKIKQRRIENLDLNQSDIDYVKFALVNPKEVLKEVQLVLPKDPSNSLTVAVNESIESLNKSDHDFESTRKGKKRSLGSSMVKSDLDKFSNNEEGHRFEGILRCLLDQPEVIRYALRHPSNDSFGGLFCPRSIELPR